MAKPVIDISNIDAWKHNDMSFPTFNNTYDSTTNTNTLLYMGGNGYERLYLGVECTANQQVSFSVKFCSPTGYSCSYGDSQEYIAITSNKPNNVQELWSQTVVASTPLDGTASNTPVLYTVSYTPTTDKVLYLVIDYGYMVDGTQVTLVYQDITLTGGTIDIGNMWYVEDNRLINQYLPAPIANVINYPYPPFWWYVNSDNRLVNPNLPDPLPYLMIYPYPPFWWYVDNNKLKTMDMPNRLIFGAFSNCENIEELTINKGTKYIAEDTFIGTAITEVTIASDCTYYDNSFPEDCTITYYPD